MSPFTDIAARHQRQLEALAELGMAAAATLAARLAAAEQPADIAALAQALERMTRAVRLTQLLEQRTAQEARRTLADDKAASGQGMEQRRKQVQAIVGRAIDNEIERPGKIALKLELADRLDQEVLFDSFAEGPIEPHIARLRQAFGLPAQAPGAASDDGDTDAAADVACGQGSAAPARAAPARSTTAPCARRAGADHPWPPPRGQPA